MASDCAHGGCGRFSAKGARGPARKTRDEGKETCGEGGEAWTEIRFCPGLSAASAMLRRRGSAGHRPQGVPDFPRRLPLRPASPDVPQRDGRSPNVARARGSRSRPTLSAGAQAPRLLPRPALAPPLFPLPSLFLTLRPGRFRAPLHLPRAPARRFLSSRLPTKKRAEFPPRVFSCGPDAAAVHRRIRTCIQNEARRASRS